jgi:hypothetical protein
LTACGPDDTPGSTGASGTPSASVVASASTSAKPSGSAKPSDCPTVAAGHMAIHADNVNGAMNHVEAYIAKANCSPGLPNGPTWEATTKWVELTFSTSAKTKIIYDQEGLKQVAWDVALRHIQSCGQPDKYPTPKGEECMGNFYDVVVNGSSQITELTQLYHV